MRIISLIIILFSCSSVWAKSEPTLESCKNAFAKVAQNHGTYQTAINEWQKHKSACPKDGAFEKYNVAIYGRENMCKEALEYLENAAKGYKTTPKRILYSLSELHALLGDKEQSLVFANKLVEQYPDWEGGYRLLGVYAGHMGNHEKAREYLLIAITQKDEGPNAWNYMSLVKENYLLKNYEDAALSIIAAIDLDITIALLSKSMTSYGAFSLIKSGEAEGGKRILQQQAKYDPAATNLPAFKEAVALYEKTTGKTLDYKES